MFPIGHVQDLFVACGCQKAVSCEHGTMAVACLQQLFGSNHSGRPALTLSISASEMPANSNIWFADTQGVNLDQPDPARILFGCFPTHRDSLLQTPFDQHS